jgi:hypothetical protein
MELFLSGSTLYVVEAWAGGDAAVQQKEEFGK